MHILYIFNNFSCILAFITIFPFIKKNCSFIYATFINIFPWHSYYIFSLWRLLLPDCIISLHIEDCILFIYFLARLSSSIFITQPGPALWGREKNAGIIPAFGAHTQTGEKTTETERPQRWFTYEKWAINPRWHVIPAERFSHRKIGNFNLSFRTIIRLSILTFIKETCTPIYGLENTIANE